LDLIDQLLSTLDNSNGSDSLQENDRLLQKSKPSSASINLMEIHNSMAFVKKPVWITNSMDY